MRRIFQGPRLDWRSITGCRFHSTPLPPSHNPESILATGAGRLQRWRTARACHCCRSARCQRDGDGCCARHGGRGSRPCAEAGASQPEVKEPRIRNCLGLKPLQRQSCWLPFVNNAVCCRALLSAARCHSSCPICAFGQRVDRCSVFFSHRAFVADAEELSAIACGSVDALTCANGLMFLPSHERYECTNPRGSPWALLSRQTLVSACL